MAATSAPAVPARPTRRRALRSRLLVAALDVGTSVLRRLPDTLSHRLAHAAGVVLYHARPERRALVRANLAQVCSYLAQRGLVEPDSPAAAAARDQRALDGLVRSAFGHYVRTYLEVAIVPAYASPSRADRIVPDDPALVGEVFGVAAGREASAPPESGAVIVVALHFGAIELPAMWGIQRGLRITAPMETLGDAHLQAYIARSRGAAGLRIIPTRGAARELTAALGRGEVVAVVADRPVSSAGARVELFGRPARVPLGPAMLSLESGAPAWLVTCRRVGWGTYRGHLERIELPAEGSRRARLAGFLEAEARAVERAVARAPEQWWTLFFPIWSTPGAERDTSA